MQSLEQTGEKFSLETYFNSQNLCKEVVTKIQARVCSGMNETDGQALIKEEFKKVGVTHFWHPSKFRIGSDTVKNFRDLPENEIKISDGEVYFLDVGPIIEQHEADFGETFVHGSAPSEQFKNLASDVKEIWNQTAEVWKKERISGLELLKQATRFAEERNYNLNASMAGHRLGDFPHALFSKEKLFSLNFSPSSNLWVLEIHILTQDSDSTKVRGAFFEDILN